MITSPCFHTCFRWQFLPQHTASQSRFAVTRFPRPNPLPSGSFNRFRSSRSVNTFVYHRFNFVFRHLCLSGSWVGHPYHGPDACFPVEHRSRGGPRSRVDRRLRFRADHRLRFRVDLRLPLPRRSPLQRRAPQCCRPRRPRGGGAPASYQHQNQVDPSMSRQFYPLTYQFYETILCTEFQVQNNLLMFESGFAT